MSFDPFDDFESRGYLRNFAQEKDQRIVRDLEHRSFKANIHKALETLSKPSILHYPDILNTHKILFESVYPWAGQDRAQTVPEIAVSRGGVFFAHPDEAAQAIEYALKLGQDMERMKSHPGEVMSYLAHAHPFLDGNGRTILTVHTKLAQRAGFSVAWEETDKAAYLDALTEDLLNPKDGILDLYLLPFLCPAVSRARLASHIVKTQGLEGDDYFPEVEYTQYTKTGKNGDCGGKKPPPLKP
ncbi:MAG: Fic family protein [Alphaproteobacteria bacterium]|nr:Fic family protein [Alphaproteobacteria bacterium]